MWLDFSKLSLERVVPNLVCWQLGTSFMHRDISGLLTSRSSICTMMLSFSSLMFLIHIILLLVIIFFCLLSLVCCLLQPNFPVRSELDVKLGGTQCNLILNRLEPWMAVRLPQKPKKEPIEKSPAKEKSHSSGQKKIMWTCNLSAPEMTVVLYSLSGCPLYHVSTYPLFTYVLLHKIFL